MASPIASNSNYYDQSFNDLLKNLYGGSANKESNGKAAAENTLSHYFRRYFGSYAAKKESNDETTAILESLANFEDSHESEGAQDRVFMQGLLNVMAKIEEEEAKEMDRTSAKAQFLRGLGRALWNSGKEYIADQICPSRENPTASA